MKILIVDDSTVLRRLITNILNSAGYSDILQAESGSQALKSLSGVGLILTNWNMPEMDGIAFAKKVRKNPATSDVPIIMITAEGTKDAVMEALGAGVNEYIVKPFTRSTLLEKLQNFLDEGNTKV